MKTLIITEKPSVARDFAKALNLSGSENQQWVLVPAVGHLLELFEPQEYDPKWKSWSLESLPILPPKFRYKPINKSKDVLDRIVNAIHRTDIEKIIIATDAGREGELIARTILDYAQNQKPVYRFWTSQALTPEVIKEELSQIKEALAYEPLFLSGQGRQWADWLVGMNLSRAATIRFRVKQFSPPKAGASKDADVKKAKNEVFSVGRVQTAVLALLVQRRKEIDLFKPEPYWTLWAEFEHQDKNDLLKWRGQWFEGDNQKFKTKEEAHKVYAEIKPQDNSEPTALVVAAKKEKKKTPPPLLYSLTELQKEANRKFGFSAQKTLDLAQALYETQKCLSYPRSDSEVLGSKNVELVRGLYHKLKNSYKEYFAHFEEKQISLNNKRIFNDEKLTDHHALIPLAPIPDRAHPDEHKVFDLVLRRFAAAFHPDYQFETTEVITEVAGHKFKTKGKTVIAQGWRLVLDEESKETLVPPLKKNMKAQVRGHQLEEKTTTPPSEYTEASLLNDMTNPARYVEEKDLKSIFRGSVGLGTQATRANIIEKLLEKNYIQRKGKILSATAKGCLLIEFFDRMKVTRIVAHPKESARWEMELKKISEGQAELPKFLRDIFDFIKESIAEFRVVKMQADRCPKCGAPLVRGKKFWGCSRWKEGCDFVKKE